MIATDNETDGSPCYTDKSVAKSGDKAYWTIAKVEAEHSEPYVALRNIVFSTATSVRYSLDDTQTTVTVGGSTPATGLTVSSNSLNLLTGTSQALVVSPSPANATWTSSDPLVATVTNDGVVTGVKQGSATITCTVNGQSSTPFPVTVISLGDINRDGNISIADVTALVNIILGKP
ncbi:MAG: Ig-like domain-containing protein [Bacteroidaceae bacterium]|nr:Ig-like domain-containing protein [Bacteroidaceae bacterium]